MEKLDEKEIVAQQGFLISQMIQTDTILQLLIEKGIFTGQEFFTKLKQVQAEYQKKKSEA